MAKSKKVSKSPKRTIKVGKAKVKMVSISSFTTKVPGSSKTRIMSRRAIGQPNVSEKRLRELVSDYAKAANKRLRNLEKANVDDASAAYRQIRTYSRDKREFMATTKKGEFKFRTDVRKMDKRTLMKEAMELDTFLFRAKTSTVRGVKEHYEKVKASIGRQDVNDTKTQRVMDYFNNMSMAEFNEFWENKSMSLMIKMYGSDEVVKLIQEGEDKGIDLEKMDEFFADTINSNAKAKPIKELENKIRKDMKDYMNGPTNEFESTEPQIGVDEDGFMKLF